MTHLCSVLRSQSAKQNKSKMKVPCCRRQMPRRAGELWQDKREVKAQNERLAAQAEIFRSDEDRSEKNIKGDTMPIKKVAVIGAGTMGGGIAAHAANTGCQVVLLDIAPTELTPEEQAKGLTLEAKVVRNRVVSAL